MPIPIPEIVKRIREEKCVLLFGPGVAKCESGETLRTLLNEYFKKENLGVKEDLDDLYTCERKNRIRALDHLQEYCSKHGEPSTLHRELARIPCHLYISTNPDLLMKQALDDCGVDHEFKYYVKDETPKEVDKPTFEKPLLYNLFGTIDIQKSIIFSQGDLIQYLFSIIKEFRLPQNLREALKEANYFIFLGFDFEKWYLKLLLRLILEESKPSIATNEGKRFNKKLKSFYQRRYGLEFVNTDIDQYIKNLYKECQKKGLLREKREVTRPDIQQMVKQLIAQDEVKQALELLIEFMENEKTLKDRERERKDFLNELYIHSGKISRNEKDFRKGQKTQEAFDVDQAKIHSALIQIASSCG